MDFDAIVVGSGISGGWVAKELCERGLKTLVIERGRNVKHRTDYLDFSTPWEVPNRGMVPEAEVRRALRHPEHRATRSTPPPSNGGCATASIRTRRRRIGPSPGFAAITSAAARSPGAARPIA